MENTGLHTWMYGSNAHMNRKVFAAPWRKLKNDAYQWRSARVTAKSDRYNTGSRYDDGPGEFQVAERALRNGRGVERSVNEVVDGIRNVITGVL